MPPLILAHRGAHEGVPENTLLAFQRAMQVGADGIECDVRLSEDGELVVIHDETLERLVPGGDRRLVAKVSATELGRLDLGHGAPVPTLREVFRWAESARAWVNVELKTDGAFGHRLVGRLVRLCRELPNHQLPDRLLFSSFSWNAVALASRSHLPGPVGWLLGSDNRLGRSSRLWKWLGAQGVHPSCAIATERRISAWRSMGAMVNVWTVNDDASARQLAHWGVDSIITDVPAQIRHAVDR